MGASPQTPGILRIIDISIYKTKRKGRTIKYGPMPTSPASALGLLPSSCPILRAGEDNVQNMDKWHNFFFNIFSVETQNSNRSNGDIRSILVA